MNQLLTLAWKEWREIRVYLWIAIGLFIVLPVIGGVEQLFQHVPHFDIHASAWVVMFGGVLAVFVAVGATCRDFTGRLDDFWRSRPVSVTRWLVTKYFIGLGVVIAGNGLPLLLERLVNKHESDVQDAIFLPFVWAASYSAAFLIGCLVRQTAQAATLGLAALLLFLFLPVVLPPLQWMSVPGLDARPVEIVRFIAGMLALSAAALWLSLVAVRRDWRIESGRKLMYGSFSLALLILCGSASYQLGTNLPILQQVDLPPGEHVSRFNSDGPDKCLTTFSWVRSDGTVNDEAPYDNRGHFERWRRAIYIHGNGITLGAPSPIATDSWEMEDYRPDQIRKGKTCYEISEEGDPDRGLVTTLRIMNGDGRDEQTPLQLWTNKPWGSDVVVLHFWENQLYVVGNHLVKLDISDPERPRIISNEPIDYHTSRLYAAGEEILLPLPPIPEMPLPERLKIAVKTRWWTPAFEGDTLCIATDDGVSCYHSNQSTEAIARFKKVGEYRSTVFERFLGASYSHYGYDMELRNGILYVSQDLRHASLNAFVKLFDTRGPQPLRPIGHFAAPEARQFCTLPDGRCIVGGKKLWLVGPPPDRNRAR